MIAFEIAEDGTLKECEDVGPVRMVRVDGAAVLVEVKLSRRDRRRRARRHRTRTQGVRVPASDTMVSFRYVDSMQRSTTFAHRAMLMGEPVEAVLRFVVYAESGDAARDAVARNKARLLERFRPIVLDLSDRMARAGAAREADPSMLWPGTRKD